MKVYKIFLLSFFLIPIFAFADLEITEIMYNPEGSDDGYEYVKIKNTSGGSIDIGTYYFFENDTNHGLYPDNFQFLNSGSSALIVKDITTAISRYGNSYSYIKSSFSLSNTGEVLSISDSDKNIIHSITYTSDMGGNGDGNPLVLSQPSDNSNDIENQSNNSDMNNDLGNEEGSSNSYNPYYVAHLDVPSQVIAKSYFPINAWVIHKKGSSDLKKKGGVYYINFGDGNARYFDERIENMDYSYSNPGDYHVIFEFYRSSLAFENKDAPDAYFEKTISVLNHDITIDSVDLATGVSLRNNTSKKIDLEGWRLVYGSHSYSFPRLTFISAHSDLVVPFSYLGFPDYIQNFEGMLIVNNAHVPIYSFSKSYYAEKTNSQTSIQKNLDGDINSFSFGGVVHVADAQETDNHLDEILSFRENDISDFTSQQAHSNSKKYLWIMGGVIVFLSFLKYLLGEKKSHSYNKSEQDKQKEDFNIELVE